MRLACLVGVVVATAGAADAGSFQGYVDTDLGPLTSRATHLAVRIEAGTAITRLTQRFEDDALAGDYVVHLPSGAYVTDVVVHYGRQRLQAGLLPAQIAGADAQRQRVEVEADRAGILVRLPLASPGPASTTVEVEFAQQLVSRHGVRRHALPLRGLTTDTLRIEVVLPGYALASVSAAGSLAPAAIWAEGESGPRLVVAPVPVAGADDLDILVAAAAGVQVRSWRQGVDMPGFFSVRFAAGELASAARERPAISIATDLAAATAQEVAWMRAGLRRLFDSLPDTSWVGMSAVGTAADRWLAPAPLDAARRGDLAALLEALQGGPKRTPPRPDLPRAVRAALGPGRLTRTRPHLLLVITGPSVEAEAARSVLTELALGLDPRLQVHVIQAGRPHAEGLAATLAAALGGSYVAVQDSAAVATALARVTAAAAQDYVFVGPADLPEGAAYDVVGDLGWQPVDGEVWQSGRYRVSGTSRVRIRGPRRRWTEMGTVRLAAAAPGDTLGLVEGLLVRDDFEDGRSDRWIKSGGTVARWTTRSGALRVDAVREIARVYRQVDATSYTISLRVRSGGGQAKIILLAADRNEYWRLDLFRSGLARVVTTRQVYRRPSTFTPNSWHDIRIEVGAGVVSTWIDGNLVHDRVPLGGAMPDGVIGLGAYAAAWVEFDDVLVIEGTGGDQGLVRGLLPNRSDRLPARLWAEAKAAVLTRQAAGLGEVGELVDALLDLGLGFGVITKASPLAFVLPPAPAPQRPVARVDSAAWPRPTTGLVNWPNPFNATTVLWWTGTAATGQRVWIDIYDLLGQRVRRLPLAPRGILGQTTWDGRDESGRAVASGIYYARVSSSPGPPRALLLLR